MSDIAAVQLRRVTKSFAGGIKAVDELTLEIPAGHILALLGPSGCGKTTTLRLINRLEEATSGEVLVHGQDVRQQRPEVLRRSIGYVIQEGGLFPHQDVATNVATVPRLLRWQRRRIRQRVSQVLELVGLPEARFGRRMPAELSGGHRPRGGPDMLLMDEPFGALDPGTREAIHDEFLRLQEQIRKTVVLVTHDVVEAGRLAEEIVLLDHGRIVQRGPLRDLLLRPADARVRGFLGRRAQELALDVLQVGQVLKGLAPGGDFRKVMRLAVNLPLGQALITLADVGADVGAAVDGPGVVYSAQGLRARILADLEAANGGGV
jgi:osmoprotectant transport system ATP-binding protein